MNARVRKHKKKKQNRKNWLRSVRVYIEFVDAVQLNVMFIVVFSYSISPVLWAITIANEKPIFIVWSRANPKNKKFATYLS